MNKPAGDRFVLTGVVAAILIIAVSLLLTAPFSPEVFGGWVTFIWVSAVPALLVIGLQWHYEYPQAIHRQSQPVKGLVYLGLTLVAMAIAGAFLYYVPGKGAGPRPMLINATIMSVIATFWVVVVWRSWPLSLIFKSQVILGIAAWVLSYVLAYAAFEIFFNFSAIRHAPFYADNLDPHGLFDAWPALVFSVTTSAVIVALGKMFEFWPIEALPGSDRPFLRGAYGTALVLVLSAAWMWLFTHVLHMDIVDFMVRGPITLIFGAFVVTNLMQFKLFVQVAQPMKGVALLLLAAVSGFLLEEMYRLLGPMIVGEPLGSAAPHYEVQLWVASALLGVTFPMIVIFTGFFGLWPLLRKSSESPQASPAPGAVQEV